MNRTLSYQLVLKSKATSPVHLHFVALRGPYAEMAIRPMIQEAEFCSENNESGYVKLPIADSAECNKLLAAKTVNVRLIMFLVPK